MDVPGTYRAMPLMRSSVNLLARLDPEERDVVWRASAQRVVNTGEAICTQGERSDRFYIVLQGEVVVERNGAPIAILGPGEFFGESGLLMRGRRSATVRATQPSLVWSVGHTAFQRVLCHHLMTEQQVRLDVLSRIEQTPPGAFR